MIGLCGFEFSVPNCGHHGFCHGGNLFSFRSVVRLLIKLLRISLVDVTIRIPVSGDPNRYVMK